MKHNVTFLAIAITVAVVFLFCGCSSRKKLINEEQNTEVLKETERLASDEVVIEYKVDTTRFTDEVVEIERTEYYDIQYYDSVADVQKQLVRAKQKTTITKKESKNGVSVLRDSTRTIVGGRVLADSTSMVVHKEKANPKKNVSLLWLLLIVLVIAYIIKRRFL